LQYRFIVPLVILLICFVASCKDQTHPSPDATARESASTDAKKRANECARTFWSTPRVDECSETLSNTCTSLLATDSEHFHQLKYVNFDEVTLAFDGVVIRKVTEPLRAIDAALRLCPQFQNNEQKLALLNKVDAVFAGAMKSMRRDLGVDPAKSIPSTYVQVAIGRVWIHGQLLKLLPPDSSEAKSAELRFQLLEKISRSAKLEHEVP